MPDHVRWCAVYGAMIAQQVMDRMKGGMITDDVDMERFVEEAKCIADMSESCICSPYSTDRQDAAAGICPECQGNGSVYASEDSPYCTCTACAGSGAVAIEQDDGYVRPCGVID